MLRCASSFVIAAYTKIRLIPQDSRVLPAAFLRSRLKVKQPDVSPHGPEAIY
jgi:hypothetical protein